MMNDNPIALFTCYGKVVRELEMSSTAYRYVENRLWVGTEIEFIDSLFGTSENYVITDIKNYLYTRSQMVFEIEPRPFSKEKV